jgi:hypothetical protein
LRWEVRGEVADVSVDQGIGTVPGTDSRRVTPSQSVTYTLKAAGPGGTSTRRVTVSVTAPAPVTPADTLAKDRQAILQTLTAYSNAVQDKDEQSIRSVWPTIPAGVMESWKTDFHNARAITLEFRQTSPIDPQNGFVRVECATKLHKEYTDTQAYNSEVVTRFALRQQAGRWIIESAR